jgi:hypothetical protein
MPSTTFLDYSFSLTENGDIRFDPEITPEHLVVGEGDQFTVEIRSGTVVFVRRK